MCSGTSARVHGELTRTHGVCATRPAPPCRDTVDPVTRTLRRMLDDERVRFVIVGGVNTVVAYVLFVVFEWVTGGAYLLSLAVAYLLATLLAFVLHRRYTFGVSGRESVVVDFLRFEGVYVVMFTVNAALLFVFVTLAAWPSWIAQAVIVVITTVLSYVGHKFFSFRRRERSDPI